MRTSTLAGNPPRLLLLVFAIAWNSNTDASVGFIAVYAGANREQGQQFLETVKQTGKFPGANLRRMQAILHYP